MCNLKKSNSSHKRLIEVLSTKADEAFMKNHSFDYETLEKIGYHEKVLKEQEKQNKVLSKNEKSKIYKLNASNYSHKKLSNHNNYLGDEARNNSRRGSESLKYYAKRDYHDLVRIKQEQLGRKLTWLEKRKIYKECVDSLIEYRKFVNKTVGYRVYNG